METIDLNRIREALPNRAEVKLIKYKGVSPAIEIHVTPSLSEKDFEMCKQWQREIIGQQNISEFYTEETGHHWYVFLKRVPLEFANVSDSDLNTFTNLKLTGAGGVLESIKK